MRRISFDGRVGIVTGAGGGLGRAHALEIALRGGKVLVNDLGGDVAGRGGSASMAETVVEEIRKAGGTAAANHDSVASTQGCEAIVAQAIAEFGKVDVLVNNAGIMRNATLENTSDEDWDAVIATHLTGSFKLTRAVWPHMKAQGYGRIVYTASSAGIFGNPMVGGYGAAKAGIAGLMNVAALEGESHGILCNALMPHAISRMAMQAAADWAGKLEGIDEPMPDACGNSMNPEFNTPLAIYLASEACTATHGLFSQCLGRAARVFIGATPGWQAQRQAPPSVEDIAAHWDEICDTANGFDIPLAARQEHEIVLSRG
ncbi:SDR family NAD(P)-dependent oxidoreductase [Novosphingobium mangrovi (ex Huang et al. 2023)]|uniref:SDR family NAD(P)-dependent oxidoreductase n=1 Tax=Novosphingobium mangrovi (ex Huang et al. 2023) TaxID=2976432 RepID=A0ABT2I546_9SPHN|nr:SDR family NAD(P)-dependent oxidoreductase [Novosphingobium mangrovi (ex Huang et al. 2023)]MCT2399922.1 SDR family NAD(P)-dependent oxidoreductase [Novosphingobium mangrovi (ex Huang et al. 2023)]